MSYIAKRAYKFVEDNLDVVGDAKQVISEVRYELADIDSDLDKSIFLQEILLPNEKRYKDHLKHCGSPENCPTNYFHETISYYLNQELSRLGVRTDQDQFSDLDLREAEFQIEQLLKEVGKKFDEQTEQYNIIKKELAELKELVLLGKKKWHQLLVGKAVEMVVSGVVSGTISEEIIKLPSRFFDS